MATPPASLHGFMHPIGGLDHVLAMVAVGVFAFVLGRPGALARAAELRRHDDRRLPARRWTASACRSSSSASRFPAIVIGGVGCPRQADAGGRRDGAGRRSSRSSTATPTAPKCRPCVRPRLCARLHRRDGPAPSGGIAAAIGVAKLVGRTASRSRRSPAGCLPWAASAFSPAGSEPLRSSRTRPPGQKALLALMTLATQRGRRLTLGPISSIARSLGFGRPIRSYNSVQPRPGGRPVPAKRSIEKIRTDHCQ